MGALLDVMRLLVALLCWRLDVVAVADCPTGTDEYVVHMTDEGGDGWDGA
jgi:hypothetical protein